MTAQQSDPKLEELNRRLARKVQQLESLIELGRVLAGIVDPSEVARRLGLTLAGQLALKSYAILACREGHQPLIRAKSMAFVGDLPKGASQLLKELGATAHPFTVEDAPSEVPRETVGALRRGGVTAVVPLVSGETTIGCALLGKPSGRNDFDEEDLLYAFGMAAQAVVSLEGAWLSLEATQWKQLLEAGEEWRALDRLSRLVFAGLTRLGRGEPPDEGPFAAELSRVLGEAGFTATEEQIRTSIGRLMEVGAIARDDRQCLRVENRAWLSLPDLRKPLSELTTTGHQRIGAYEIVSLIGAGGMGEVFRGRNVHDGSVAAVKLLRPTDATDEQARRLLEREGKIVASISHPNIVRLLERGEHDGRLYIAMEYIDGEPLSRYLQRNLPGEREVIDGCRQIASALATLHAHHVVHRDLKSANIMRTSVGKLVLLDFGLAKSLDTTVTCGQAVMGSLAYMSPEQLRGDLLSPATDVWAFGVVLYEMLTGALPWKSKEIVGMAVEILHEAPAIGSPILDHPPGLLALLHDTFELDPAKRIPDGAALLKRIEAIHPEGISSPDRPAATAAPDEITRTIEVPPRAITPLLPGEKLS